jgi:hypothetical protein
MITAPIAPAATACVLDFGLGWAGAAADHGPDRVDAAPLAGADLMSAMMDLLRKTELIAPGGIVWF